MMENLRINETPVRTSRNFNINNITLKEFTMPEKITEFNGTQIECDSSKIIIENETAKENIQYGISEQLTKQILENANQKIKVTIQSKTEKQAKVYFRLDEHNPVLTDHIEINANEDTKATVMVLYSASQQQKCYHNGMIRVNAKENAKVHVIVVNLLNTVSNHFLAIENTLQKNANVKYTMVDFGGKNSVTNYYANLVGKGADNQIYAIYLGKENQTLDLNYIGELRGQVSNIDIEVQGALKDTARKHFKGTIDFKKGCKKATGNENENCILLSDTAKSIALPMLLCSAEEVEGKHSSSAGKIEEKELFK